MIRLTPTYRIILWRLALRGRASYDELCSAIWHPHLEPDWSHTCLLVHICKMRQRLPAELRSTIRTRWGWGLEIAPAHQPALASYLALELEKDPCPWRPAAMDPTSFGVSPSQNTSQSKLSSASSTLSETSPSTEPAPNS